MDTVQTTPASSPVQPVKKRKSAPRFILAITLFIAGITFIGFGVILATQFDKKQNITIIPSPTPTESASPTPTPVDTTPSKRIVYISNNSLWITDTKGQAKKKIKDLPATKDVVYGDPLWKSANEVTYAGCLKDKCNMYTVNLQTSAQTVEIGDVSGNIIHGIWIDNKNVIYGLFTNPATIKESTNDRIFVRAGSNNTQIQTFSTKEFFVELYEDDIVRFSKTPDKSKVLLFNLRAGNAGDDYNTNTYIFSKTGSKLMEFKSVSVDFLNDKKVAYIFRDTLHLADIGGKETDTFQIVYEAQEVLLQLRAAPSGDKVSFWSATGGSHAFIYDIKEKKRTKVSDSFIPEGQWLSDEFILGRSTTTNATAPSGFVKEKGISVINTTNGQIKNIVSEQVDGYSVE